jgi:glycine betaine/proline transport system ATP-binding protein
MEGGRIVQTGTGTQIVQSPADDYVAEFVRHASPRTPIKGAPAPS